MFARLCVNRRREHEQQHRQRDLRRREREAEPAEILAAERARAVRLAMRAPGRWPTSFAIGTSANTTAEQRRDREGRRNGRKSRLESMTLKARRLQRVDRTQHAERDRQARERRAAREQQRLDGQAGRRAGAAPRRATLARRSRRSRAAPRANIRFARLTQAISRIVAVAAKNTASGVRAHAGARLWPRAPDTSVRSWRGTPRCRRSGRRQPPAGASTSLTIARNAALTSLALARATRRASSRPNT